MTRCSFWGPGATSGTNASWWVHLAQVSMSKPGSSRFGVANGTDPGHGCPESDRGLGIAAVDGRARCPERAAQGACAATRPPIYWHSLPLSYQNGQSFVPMDVPQAQVLKLRDFPRFIPPTRSQYPEAVWEGPIGHGHAWQAGLCAGIRRDGSPPACALKT